MRFINWLILYLIPALALSASEGILFNREEHQRVRSFFITSSILLTIIYPLHYFFLDIPKGWSEDGLFCAFFRFSVGLAAFFSFSFYYKYKNFDSIFYKFIFSALCIYIITLQTILTYRFPETTLFMPFFLIPISLYVLKFSPIVSVFFSILGSTLIFTSLTVNLSDTTMVFSYAIIAVGLSLAISSRSVDSFKIFKLHLDNVEGQKKIIERQMELVDNLRGFLPKVVFGRFNEKIKEKKVETAIALDEILRPKLKNVCCLYTDIRSFTKISRDLPVVMNELVPIIRQTSDLIEEHNGIPRKIGDLVFAYFDDSLVTNNILNSLNCAISVAFSDVASKTIVERNLILTIGNAIVGNVGGSGGAIEITALGNPANLGARIDEFIKVIPEFKNSIIIPESFYQAMGNMSSLKFKEFKIKNKKIRDFESVNCLYYLPFNDLHTDSLNEIFKIGDKNGIKKRA